MARGFCPHCKVSVQGPEEMLGHNVLCTWCKGVFAFQDGEKIVVGVCPHCHSPTQYQKTLVGKEVKCPLCEGAIFISRRTLSGVDKVSEGAMGCMTVLGPGCLGSILGSILGLGIGLLVGIMARAEFGIPGYGVVGLAVGALSGLVGGAQISAKLIPPQRSPYTFERYSWRPPFSEQDRS